MSRSHVRVPLVTGHCRGPAALVMEQSVVDGELRWSRALDCTECSGFIECGVGPTPAPLREALLEHEGTARLRATPGGSNVAALRLFRATGASLWEASAALHALFADGLSGTTAEMDLIADQLRAAGFEAHVDVDVPPRPPQPTAIVTFEEARELAGAFMNARLEPRLGYDVVIQGAFETEAAFVFPYDGRAYIEHGDFRSALAGNAPIVVLKHDGSVDFDTLNLGRGY